MVNRYSRMFNVGLLKYNYNFLRQVYVYCGNHSFYQKQSQYTCNKKPIIFDDSVSRMYDYKVGKPATDAWISSLSRFLFVCSPRFCVLLHLLASSSSRFIFSLLLLAFSSLASFACLFFSLFFSHFLLFSPFRLPAVSSHYSLIFSCFSILLT